jgi:predicted nucleotidyltransferase
MNDTERLEHKIKCLENRIEHFENIPSEYKYVWDKDWDDMTEEERTAYYNSIPAAKLTPVEFNLKDLYVSPEAVEDIKNWDTIIEETK